MNHVIIFSAKTENEEASENLFKTLIKLSIGVSPYKCQFIQTKLDSIHNVQPTSSAKQYR